MLSDRAMRVFLHSGDNAYGYAALKSLPLSDENSGPSEGSGAAAGSSEDGDKELAHALMGQCTAMLEGEAIVTPSCHHRFIHRSTPGRGSLSGTGPTCCYTMRYHSTMLHHALSFNNA